MIIVITGLMASGKSTVAQLLAERFARGVHLRGDAFRRMIVSGREDMADPPTEEAYRQLDLRYRLTADAARGYHAADFDVVVQDNYYGERLPFFIDLLGDLPVQVVVLCPDAETIARREDARGKVGYTGFSVQTLYDAFLATTPRIGLWVDSSGQTPEETVGVIVAGLGLG